jgi:SAM-dependent methyltransferase
MARIDKSHGYDDRAQEFAERRHSTIGAPEVERWARTLPAGAAVLDLGCGIGEPIGAALERAGCEIYGIDASARMIDAFKRRLPHAHAACEPAEDSPFFNRTFDGIVAWGLMFLLPRETQERIIAKAGKALKPNGSFLFTAPTQVCEWNDNLTGRRSISLGADEYRRRLTTNGLTVTEEFEDEGDNHYYVAIKK